MFSTYRYRIIKDCTNQTHLSRFSQQVYIWTQNLQRQKKQQYTRMVHQESTTDKHMQNIDKKIQLMSDSITISS